MPNFAQELGKTIRHKVINSIDKITQEGLKPDGGCLVAAIDGLCRSAIPQTDHGAHIRNKPVGKYKRIDSIVEVGRIFQEVFEPVSELSLRYYSSSPSLLQVNGTTNQPLSHKEAVDLARRLKNDQTFGVIIGKEQRRAKGTPDTSGHVESLIGVGGKIIHVDTRRYNHKLAQNLTTQETVRVLRRSQRGKGLIVEIGAKSIDT